LLGCADDDDENTSAGDDLPATTTDGSTGATTTATTTTGAETTNGDTAADTTTGGTTGGSTTGDDTGVTSLLTTGPTCDVDVPGEWNSCIGENGQIDNTLCNWMGTSGSTGFIGCLSSSKDPDANVCFISGCEDECDCFDAPATGNATVVCAEILKGGGTACALDCSNDETCPDGMVCSSGLCFWPPA
jgi:hypothetical protein